MIGRWPGGAPLTLSPETDDPDLSRADNFLYRDMDDRGLRCPFGAHIRRTNPRDQLRPAGAAESLHMTSRHRILRRGRRYGSPLFNLAVLEQPNSPAARQLFEQLADDGEKRGLNFFCINASIKSQFEFVQQAWINNARTNGNLGNPDPMSSQSASTAEEERSMLIPRLGLDLRTSRMPAFVKVRAGAYFFLPSHSALAYLTDPGGS
jgi:deferrochelatase/peroxidase EfeB